MGNGRWRCCPSTCAGHGASNALGLATAGKVPPPGPPRGRGGYDRGRWVRLVDDADLDLRPIRKIPRARREAGALPIQQAPQVSGGSGRGNPLPYDDPDPDNFQGRSRSARRPTKAGRSQRPGLLSFVIRAAHQGAALKSTRPHCVGRAKPSGQSLLLGRSKHRATNAPRPEI